MGKRNRRQRNLARNKQQSPSQAQGQPVSIQQLMQVQAEHFQGPLPHPKILSEYEAIVPGAADRLIVQFERQSAHRQALERAVLDGNIAAQKTGSIYGLVVALAGLGTSAWLIAAGHTIGGSFLGGVDLTGLVAVFVIGRTSQDRERKRKRDLM